MVVIDFELESATLDTEANFDLAIAFNFVYSNHFMDMASLWHVRAAHELPGAVASVVA